MDNFCGSPFWQQNLTWNTTSQPDFTRCFQETALVWFPCLILWLLAPLNIISVYKSERRYIPFTLLNLFKTFLAMVLCILSLTELIETLTKQPQESSEGTLLSTPLVDYVTPIIKALTYVLVFGLYVFHRRKGVHTSGIILLFWILMSITVVINFRSILRSNFQDSSTINDQWANISELKFTLRIVSAPIVIVQLVLSCIADKRAEDVSVLIGENQRNKSPEREASILSQLTFWWLNPIMLLGYKRPLTQEDLYSVRHQDKTEYVTQKFDELLDPAIQKALEERRAMNETFSPSFDQAYKNTLLETRPSVIESTSWFSKKGRNNRRSQAEKEQDENSKGEEELAKHVGLTMIVLKTFWPNILLAAVLKLFGSLLTFASPLLLSQIITFVRTNDEPAWRGPLYAALLFFLSLVQSLFTTNEFYVSQVNAMRIRTCATSAVYRKTLRLSNQGRNDFTAGQIVNFMSVDVQKMGDFVDTMNNIWSSPIQLIVCMCLLYQQLGIAILGGLSMMLAFIPINSWVVISMREIQKVVMAIKDKRIKLLSEILNGIKIIKIHAWEEPFRKRTEAIRKKEIDGLEKQAWFGAAITFAFTTLPFVVSLASFLLFILINSQDVLDANKIFVSLTLFNIMRVPLAILPMLFTNLTSYLVSVRRLNKFLECDEIDINAIKPIDDDKSVIKIKNGSFKWETKGDLVLDKINLEIPRMKLVAIVGSVGSGKSSLLSAILGDLEKCDGEVMVDQNSSIAYVPQEAWILNTSFKNNIMFNKVVNMDKYRRIIDACALGPDLKTLTMGDESEIGEKGLNLSGGQKQRVSLARAVYGDKDIYLLDDPLNAVDAHVGRHIFDKIIGPKGMLKDRTRVLVTNKLSVLPEVDHILVMKDGQISESGTYESLLREGGLFSKLLVDYVLENNQGLNLSEDARAELITKELRRLEEKQAAESKKSNSIDEESKERRSSSIKKPEVAKIVEERPGNLTGREFSQVGSTGLHVHLNFIKTMGINFIVGLGVFVLSAPFTISSNLWLSEWSNDADNQTTRFDNSLRNHRLTVYALLGFSEATLVIVSTILINLGILKSSRRLHNSMLARILKAPMSWFDTTPSGRIMNRFSKDIDVVDTTIRFNVRLLLNMGLRSIAALILISIGSVYSIILIIPIVLLYFLFQIFYISTSRQLKRIESTTKSPIYSHFTETILGTTSIRAFKASKEFTLESNHRVDVNNASVYTSNVASRWLAIRLETLGFIVVLSASMIAVLSRGLISPGIAGLTVSYSLNITQVLSFLVKTYSDYETNVVCIERIIEYTKVPIEPEDEEEPFDEAWPSRGEIVFDNFSTRYRPELDLVLKKFNLKINSSEKIGLCGRTGAGKSSITLSLFRVLEASEGCIIIDDVNISHINLAILRSKLSIIPQEPILFTGTIRQNIDPTNTYTDEEIWKAIDLAHLGVFLRNLESGLEHEVNEGGSNFSVGQKQLFCLARTLLRRSKILILDEATAAVDVETDNLIQQTIRKEFKNSTIVTIAHRLETIQDYDRVVVMEDGTLVEEGGPTKLMKNTKTRFHALAKEAGLTK